MDRRAQRGIRRRTLFAGLAGSAGAALLAACGSASPSGTGNNPASSGGQQGYMTQGQTLLLHGAVPPVDMDGVWFLQWTEAGGTISGQSQATFLPRQYVWNDNTDTSGFTGVRNGASVTLQFPSLLGPTACTGSVSGGTLVLSVPQRRGSPEQVTFQAATLTEYTTAAQAFLQRDAQVTAQSTATAQAQQSNAIASATAQQRDSYSGTATASAQRIVQINQKLAGMDLEDSWPELDATMKSVEWVLVSAMPDGSDAISCIFTVSNTSDQSLEFGGSSILIPFDSQKQYSSAQWWPLRITPGDRKTVVMKFGIPVESQKTYQLLPRMYVDTLGPTGERQHGSSAAGIRWSSLTFTMI